MVDTERAFQQRMARSSEEPGMVADELGSMPLQSIMQSYMDLLQLLQRPEGKTLEYKRDLSSRCR